MKIRSTFIFCFAFIFSQAAEQEPVQSSISNVTVYLQGAQVYRTAKYSIKAGVTELIIDGICPTIDPKSLQVTANGKVIIIDSKYTLFYPEPDTKNSNEALPLKVKNQIRLVEDSLIFLSYDLQELDDELNVLQESKRILANNGAIKGQGKVNDSLQLLQAAMTYYTSKMNEINKKMLKLNREKRNLEFKRSGMTERLTSLKNYRNTNHLNEKNKGPIHRVVITLSAEAPAMGKVNFSYLVSKAGWVPLYDLKSQAGSDHVNLTYKAQVFQQTGTDWDQVRLAVSTNNPYQNKTKPTLHPWYIDYVTIQQNDIRNGAFNLSGVTVTRAEKELEKDSEQKFRDARTSADFVTMVDQIVSAEFSIDLPYTILSNNEKHMVLVKSQDLAAHFKHFTIPKIDPSVYLIAQISKLDELQLVPAKANIFFEGTYMGETYIDPTMMEDTLSLSLGKDPNILVKRVLLKKDAKEKVIGNQRIRTNSFRIEVKSMKTTAIDLIVQDQIPLTQNSDIEIELLGSDKARLDPNNGSLQWEFKLKPKATEELKFAYQVKYNKEQQVVMK